MDTLQQLTDALILLVQMGLFVRFILLSIQMSDQENQQNSQFKKQRRTVLIGLIAVSCVYDIPRILQYYFGS